MTFRKVLLFSSMKSLKSKVYMVSRILTKGSEACFGHLGKDRILEIGLNSYFIKVMLEKMLPC